VIERATSEWDQWDHAGALGIIEAWFWSDFCDNYLELSKSRAYGGDASALGTARTALGIVLRLFAPFVPFIAEEVWNETNPEPSSIHRESWPRVDELEEIADDGSFELAVAVLTRVRRSKSQAKVSIRYPVTDLVVRLPGSEHGRLEAVMGDICSALAVERYELIADESLEGPETEVTLGEKPTARE